MDLSRTQQKILDSTGHVLVCGGPGSGKTTIAILKAGELVATELRPTETVVFLSFARATVARLIQALDEESTIAASQKKSIQIDTYHSFFWSILRAHGHLLGLPRPLQLLAPAAEAIRLAEIRNEYPKESQRTDEQEREKRERETKEQYRLARDHGLISFDLFAPLVAQLFAESGRLRKLISSCYPFIFFDEFQDTDSSQWDVVRLCGESSTLVALADPEQRIFDFRGAHPERIQHFRDKFEPQEYDLGTENHRSAGTEILAFGDAVLAREFREGSYSGIKRTTFPGNQNQAFFSMKSHVMNAIRRLKRQGLTSWSVGVVVPTKQMTRLVSDYLESGGDDLPRIPHSATLDVEAIILAAEIVAYMMEPGDRLQAEDELVELVGNYYLGRGGGAPNATDINEAAKLKRAYAKLQQAVEAGRSPSAASIAYKLLDVYRTVQGQQFTGDPDEDWLAVRRAMEESQCKQLHKVAEDVRDLRILRRGTHLRSELGALWREYGSYRRALDRVRNAFVAEHFAISQQGDDGVVVTNMHKVKGKQFDEVVIFEGWPRVHKGRIQSNPGRIVRSNALQNVTSHSLYNFRVSITRARQRTTILTPKNDPCVLLKSRS